MTKQLFKNIYTTKRYKIEFMIYIFIHTVLILKFNILSKEYNKFIPKKNLPEMFDFCEVKIGDNDDKIIYPQP